MRSELNCWFCASVRQPCTSPRSSTSRSGSSHDVTARHTFGSLVDTRTVRKRMFPESAGNVCAPWICTTRASSGVAEPGEMITYGTWTTNPASTMAAIRTPTLDSTTATTVCLRLARRGTGSARGAVAGGSLVIRLRSRGDSLAVRPGSTGTGCTRSRALDGYAHAAACHAAHAVRRARRNATERARRPPRHRLRAHGAARRRHRLPRRHRARDGVRGHRHRDQRPPSVSDAGPVARAAELAALGHHAPVDRVAIERLLVAIDGDPDARVRAAALGALVRVEAAEAADAWSLAVTDPSPMVRRRAVELAPALPRDARIADALVAALGDVDVTVVEAA